MSSQTGFKRIGLADVAPRGQGLLIPRSGTGGGGEFGADITNELRTFAVTREPVAHRIVFTVAHDIFDNWFNLELESEEVSEKSQQFDKQVQLQLTKLHAKQELMRMAVFERAYGYAIIVLGYKDEAKSLAEPLTNAADLVSIKAYSPTQIANVTEVTDKNDSRYGLPKIYHIQQRGIASLKVHYTRVIHFATRLLDHDWKGKSTLDPIWDDLVTLRNIRWGMGQTMFRYGSGFPDLTFTGAELADIEAYIDSGAFANLSARTYFAHSEDQTLEFKGLQGRALDPMNYYLPPMEHISCGSGIPLAIIRGVQAGALTGSEVNQQEYYGLISDEQSGYEEGIRELIKATLKFNGFSEDNIPEFEFNWKGGFELDEEKKANIEMIKAQILQIQAQWHTRNEIRKMEDPNAEDLSEEQGGNEIMGKAQPFQKKQEEPFNLTEIGDSYIVTPVNKRRSNSSSGRQFKKET